MRAFHTERVGNASVGEEAGDVFMFMYASHDDLQELVGITGGATSLIEDEPRRQRLAEKLRLDRLRGEAWAVAIVRDLHDGSAAAFRQVWDADFAWIPN